MNTPNSEFDLVPCDSLFSRIEENLSSYVMNGALDSTRFYSEVKWFIQQMGLAVFEMKEGIILLEKNRAELPCDFYMLDSAWLCDNNPPTTINNYFQGKYVFFTEETCEKVLNNQSCPPPNATGYSVNACHKDKVLEKVTLTEYVTGANNYLQYPHPTLLKYNNRKSVGSICSKNCRNLFVSSPFEISISKQGNSYFLHSNLKDAVIYLKYWRFPMDMETGLPLIPSDAIIQKGLEYYLTHWYLVQLWTNGDDVNLENKIKYWEHLKNDAMMDAKIYAKMPSWQSTIQFTGETRRRWNVYEINNVHL